MKNEGVKPDTDVLDVKEQRINTGLANKARQLSNRKAISAVDCEVGLWISEAALAAGARLTCTPKAMLRPKDAAEVFALVQSVYNMREVIQYAGGVRQDTHRAVFEQTSELRLIKEP